jgi:cephalosporin hydroxylase
LAHGTDKSSSNHDFAQIYEPYLAYQRHEPIALLEIGVLDGGSLRTWTDYFTRGRIFAIDIQPAALDHATDRARIFVGDQKDTQLLDRVVTETGPLDIIIDDGSHRAKDQLGSLRYLWPWLSSGGLYIMEDTHTSYLKRWGMEYREPHTTMEFLKGVADDIHARWHQHPVALPDVLSLHFYFETCIIRKRIDVGSNHGPRAAVSSPSATVRS